VCTGCGEARRREEPYVVQRNGGGSVGTEPRPLERAYRYTPHSAKAHAMQQGSVFRAPCVARHAMRQNATLHGTAAALWDTVGRIRFVRGETSKPATRHRAARHAPLEHSADMRRSAARRSAAVGRFRFDRLRLWTGRRITGVPQRSIAVGTNSAAAVMVWGMDGSGASPRAEASLV
jgi:hypothetical protein